MASPDNKSKNKLRRYVRRAVWLSMLLFLLINIIAYLHAWRFTHSTDSKDAKPKLEETGWGQKIKYALTGIPNPRPENKTTPSLPYQKVQIDDHQWEP